MSEGGPWDGCGQSQVCSEAANGGVVFNRLSAAVHTGKRRQGQCSSAHVGKRRQSPREQELMVFLPPLCRRTVIFLKILLDIFFPLFI